MGLLESGFYLQNCKVIAYENPQIENPHIENPKIFANPLKKVPTISQVAVFLQGVSLAFTLNSTKYNITLVWPYNVNSINDSGVAHLSLTGEMISFLQTGKAFGWEGGEALNIYWSSYFWCPWPEKWLHFSYSSSFQVDNLVHLCDILPNNQPNSCSLLDILKDWRRHEQRYFCNE